MNKKHTIVYMGVYTAQICETLAISKKLHVIGYIIDRSADIDTQNKTALFWNQYGVPQIEISQIPALAPSLIFVCGYWRIIKTELLHQYLFVNIHAGVLPHWRGANANSWALINGESEVGYTLHRVSDVLDGGDIYRVFKQTSAPDEKYGELRKRLLDAVCLELEDTFLQIIDGVCVPTSQKDSKFVYCNTMKAEDGIIINWDVPTSVLYGKFRIFGVPFGSGLYMIINGEQYEILFMRTTSDVTSYYCVPGSVVYKTNTETWIKTSDTLVIIGDLKDSRGNVHNSTTLLSIGKRL